MIELSSNALTTVEDVINAINMYPFVPTGINMDDPDVVEQLTRMINAWSSFVEQKTNTKFGVKEYVEYYKGTSQPTLVLKHYPVVELTSIQVVSTNGEVVGELDVDTIENMMSDEDYERGTIYVEAGMPGRYTYVGVIPDRFQSLRSYKVIYTAGYVLPKDATDLTPSTVPYALQNLVIDLVKEEFIRSTDAIRSNDLITLTEGNVQRMWADPVAFKLTEHQQQILSAFRRKSI